MNNLLDGLGEEVQLAAGDVVVVVVNLCVWRGVWGGVG